MFLLPLASLTTLKTLKIWGPESESLSTTQLLYSLGDVQLTELRSFSFTAEGPDANVQDALAVFLRRHTELDSVELCSFMPSPGVITAIASMEHLRKAKLFFHFADSSLYEFMATLAEGCSLLQDFDLNLQGSPGNKLSFGDIWPLLGCRQLSRLRITHNNRLGIKLEPKEIEEMGRAWPMSTLR